MRRFSKVDPWVVAACTVLVVACASTTADPEPVGPECNQNADCADSEAARALVGIRCGPTEFYCAEAKCHAQCVERCEVARDDSNPCPEPMICAPHISSTGHELDWQGCTMRPVACTSTAQCPRFRPATADGGQADWECVDGVCAYPGVEYATH